MEGDRRSLRAFYHRVWQKLQSGEALEPIERIVAEVITAHPDYHGVVSDPGAVEAEFPPGPGAPHPGPAGANPYLHMGLHVALVEQLQSDRPPGIRALYQRIAARAGGERHAAEHAMMQCLAEAMAQARASRPPGLEGGELEARYLACLRARADG